MQIIINTTVNIKLSISGHSSFLVDLKSQVSGNCFDLDVILGIPLANAQ